MCTASTPTGAPFRQETNVTPGSQTKSAGAAVRLVGRIRVTLILGLLAVGIQLALTGDALALGQISYGDCVSSDGSGGLCGATNGLSLSGVGSVAVSPDGKTVYAAVFDTGAVAVLNRATNGELTYAGCVSNDGSGGACADAPGSPLAGADSVKVSSDGRSVYVASFRSGAVVAFDRASGGQLIYAGCVSDDGSGGLCADSPGSLKSPSDLALSPDGTTLYVATTDGVTVLDRAARGQLTYAGCVSNDGSHGSCGTVSGPSLTGAQRLAVSRDGTTVYVTAFARAVMVFDRAGGGQITYAGCVSDDGSGGRCADVPGTPLGTGIALAVSPADDTVYATSSSTGTITALDRAAGGQLTYAGCVSDNGSGGLCADASGSPLGAATDVTVSGDGESIYVTSFAGILTVFDRTPGGQITYAGCVSNDGSAGVCRDLPGNPLTDANSVAVSPDDSSVYAAGVGATILHLLRKTAPDTQITAGPGEGSLVKVRSPTFGFASDQDSARFECAVDGHGFAACATPTTLGPLADGDHRLDVRAVTGGDADRTPASRTFRIDATGPGVPTSTIGHRLPIDTTGPRTRILRGPRSTIRTRGRRVKVRFVFVADEPVATLRCKLDRRAFTPCRSPLVYQVRPGRHSLVVQAIDPSGNAGNTVLRSFRVVRHARRSASRHVSHPNRSGGAQDARTTGQESPINKPVTEEVER
jgi:DNA-binding beta-propeller fold protein YncE